VDGQLFKQALLGALAWLSANQEEVNRLNVFPVPDGDTGTNMLLTLQSAVEDIKDSPTKEVSKIARVAAHGSLMGARGNSGVILSQIFRGFAKASEGKSELTPAEVAQALQEAANAAYRAVTKPTEGTILTVARAAGDAAAEAAQKPGADVPSVIQAAAQGARRAVEKTPQQLAILREAGVVDAGGYGLQIMLEGFLKTMQEVEGEDLDLISVKTASVAAQKSLALPEEGWGYCTEFILEGQELDVDAIRDEIAAMGNSVLVVGEPELVKVHVHTEDPSKVLSYASGIGTLTKTKVDDMSQQHRLILDESSHEAVARPEPAPAERPASRQNGVGLVAVVAGQGLVDIFLGLGVDEIVEGGQTMNPSTQDMMQAVERVPYQEVILLPNNKNVVPAASQVGKVTGKKVHVLETHTIPQGIAAAVAFSPDRSAAVNLASMREAAKHVQTIQLTHAVRDTRSNGLRVKKGDVIGLVNDKLAYAGRAYDEVVKKAVGGIGVDGYELVTIYRGEQASDSEVERVTGALRDGFPGLEVELQAGGQQHYPFILSVE
jgi:DAK2 domain fusion protein YloV